MGTGRVSKTSCYYSKVNNKWFIILLGSSAFEVKIQSFYSRKDW